MTLKEYISDLQKILEEHGDLKLIYSSDDEGNSYHRVGSSPVVRYTDFSDDFIYESMEECLDADYIYYENEEDRAELIKDFNENFEKVVLIN